MTLCCLPLLLLALALRYFFGWDPIEMLVAKLARPPGCWTKRTSGLHLDWIAAGRQTAVLRLNSGGWKEVRAGDTLEFSSPCDRPAATVLRRVARVQRVADFAEAYAVAGRALIPSAAELAGPRAERLRAAGLPVPAPLAEPRDDAATAAAILAAAFGREPGDKGALLFFLGAPE